MKKRNCVQLILAAFVAFSCLAPLCAEEAAEQIDPKLLPRDDAFMTRQAKVLLEEADAVLKRFPPQLPEPLERRLALRLIDGVAHEVYAPMRASFSGVLS